MAYSREEVYEALKTSIENLSLFSTVSRKLAMWDQVPTEEQPYLGISQANETSDIVTGLPACWIWKLDLYIYVKAVGDELPSTKLNSLLDQVCAAINCMHPVTGKNDLGMPGVVEYCRVQGTIETDEGTLGDQAVAIVPVLIYVVQQP